MSVSQGVGIHLEDGLPDKGTIENLGANHHVTHQFAEFNNGHDSPAPERQHNTTAFDDGMLSMNPVLVNAQSGTVTLTTGLAFSKLSCEANCIENAVLWEFSDVMKAISNDESELRNSIRKYNPAFAVPLSLRVLGNSLGKLQDSFALQAFDNSTPPRALHTVTAFKTNASDQVYGSGFPLFLLNSGFDKVLLKSGAFNSEHLAYWSLNMEMLNKDVTTLQLGKAYQSSVIMEKTSQAAKMANYALSVKNGYPPLLDGDGNVTQEYAYNDQGDTGNFLQMNSDVYEQVKVAYQTKFAEVKRDSYDLSKITFKLVPLPGVASEKLAEIQGAHVMVEIVAHMGTSGGTDPVEQFSASNGLFATSPGGLDSSFMAEL